MKLLRCLCLGVAFASAAQAQTSSALRSGDIDVGQGVRIHYVDGGDRQAKTSILFVPGWSMSSAVWREQMSAFASSARVVSIDPRSQGQSTITTKSNTPEQRAQDLHQVMRSLALKDVVLVGWSQGVQDVAAYAAAFEGDAVSGYVLVDAAVSSGAADSVTRPEALKQQLEMMVIYQQHPTEYLHGMMNAIIRSPEGRKRIDEYVGIGLRTPPDLGISMLVMDFIAYDRRPALAKFNRPTLIIAAAQSDELEAQRAMSSQIRGARFEVIDDAGHAVFLDQPARFQALVAAFIQRTELRQAGSSQLDQSSPDSRPRQFSGLLGADRQIDAPVAHGSPVVEFFHQEQRGAAHAVGAAQPMPDNRVGALGNDVPMPIAGLRFRGRIGACNGSERVRVLADKARVGRLTAPGAHVEHDTRFVAAWLAKPLPWEIPGHHCADPRIVRAPKVESERSHV